MNLLEQFKNYLFSQETKPSNVTVKNYSSDINHFVKWFEKQYGTILTSPITNTILEQYKASFEKTFSPASMQRHLSSLRKFFKYLKIEGKMTIDPFEESVIHETQEKDVWRLKDFKNNLFVNKAAHLTIKNYIIDVKQFIAWAKEVTGLENDLLINRLSKEFVEEYKTRLVKKGEFSPATVNRKLSSLRKYLSFAQENGLLTQNLASFGNINEAKQKLYIPSKEEIKANELDLENTPNNYSKFPPLRLVQKLSQVWIAGFDAVAIAPLVNLASKIQYATWKLRGQPIFEKGPKTFITKNITAHDLLGIKNISKQIYAPFKISTQSFSTLQKLIFNLRYTRPNWYKRYHSYAITHYFHFAVLVIFLAAVGFGIYNSFFAKPQNQPALAALPTAPPRILSFQGRLTDNNDNPITSNTNIRFAIYNNLTASGAALLWQEVDPVTPDVDGIFNAILGNVTSIPSTLFSENAALYLGVTIEATPELTPRQQLATVAYATNSETLQGLPPSTAVGASTSNVVLALDSSGNLTIGGSANPVFSASGGQFKLSGQPLLLTTNTGTDANVQITTDDLGKIDLQKPILNSTNSNNIATAIGAVEVNDLFAVLATSSGQSAVTINQTSTGPIISASAGGTAKFTVDNSGNEEIAGNLTAAGTTGISLSGNGAGITFSGTGNHDISASSGTLRLGALTLTGAVTGNSQSVTGLNNLSAAGTVTFSNFNANNNVLYATVTTGVLAGANTSTTGLCLVSGASAPSWSSCSTATTDLFWSQTNGTLYANNSTVDLLIGGQATTSAKFAVLNVNSGTPVASVSSGLSGTSAFLTADGTLATQNRMSLTIGNSSTYNTTGNVLINPNGTGNVGIGTTAPAASLAVKYASANGGSGTPVLILDNPSGGSQTVQDFRINGSQVGSVRADSSGNIVMSGTSTGSTYLAWDGGTSGTIFGNGGGAAVARINSSGNATFGSASDLASTTYKLYANGNSYINGMLTGLTGLTSSGTITFSAFTSNGGIIYTTGTGGQLAQVTAGSATQCLLGGTTPVFGACATGPDSIWQQANGAIYPNNSTVDLLVGGQATTSAKFAVLNVNSGTPVASVSSGLSGTSAYLTADGTLATQNRMSLTIGNSSTYNTTGNVLINPNGTGNVGIGTTSPTQSLEVAGNIAIKKATQQYDLLVYGSDAATYGNVGYTDGVGLDLGTSGGGIRLNPAAGNNVSVTLSGAGDFIVNTNQLYVDTSAGNVGIGTATPISELHITRPLSFGATGKALAIFDQIENQEIFTASKGGVTQFVIDAGGQVYVEGAISDYTGVTLDVNDNLDVSGTLTAGTANAFSVAATGDITTVTNETINGIDISAGAVSDVTTLSLSGAISDTDSAVTIDDDFTITTGTTITANSITSLSATSLATVTTAATVSINSATTINTNQATLSVFNSTATTLNIGGAATDFNVGVGGATAGTFDILGGSGATGCTVNGDTGNLTCSGTITGTGATGYWTRLAGNLSPATLNDTISATTSAAVALTLTQTGAFNALLVEDSASDTTPFVIDQSGNVGIGTTSPASLLDVRGGHLRVGSNTFAKATLGTGEIALDNGTTDTPGIHFYSAANTNFGIDVASSTLRFVKQLDETGGASLMSLDTSGNLLTTGNITVNGGTINTTTTNLGLILAPNGTGTVTINSGTQTSAALTINANSITTAGGRATAINSTSTATSGQDTGNYFSSTFSPGSADTASHYGLYMDTFGNTTNMGGAAVYGMRINTGYNLASGTLPNSTGVYSLMYSLTAGGTLTNAYDFYAENGQGSGTITNMYGLYVSSITKGATSNYAIYTNTGVSSLGDELIIRTGASGRAIDIQANKRLSFGSDTNYITDDGSTFIINSGRASTAFQLSAATKMSLSASTLNFAQAESITTTTGDLTLNPNSLYVQLGGVNPTIYNNSTSTTFSLRGGTTAAGSGVFISIQGKDNGGANTGKFYLATPNAATNADLTRLTITGQVTAAAVQFTNVDTMSFDQATTISTAANSNLTLSNSGTGNIILSPGANVGIGTTGPLATLDVRGNSGTTPVSSVSGTTSFAAFVVDNNGVGDLFTASKSGAKKFTIANTGVASVVGDLLDGTADLKLTGTGGSGGIGAASGQLRIYRPDGNLSLILDDSNLKVYSGTFGVGTSSQFAVNTSGAITASTGLTLTSGAITLGGSTGTTSLCLIGGATASWGSCATGTSTNYWTSTLGALYPINSTLDFFVGGQATSSAKFAVLNVNSGTPVASVSSGLSGTSAYLTADGTLATQNRMSLTLGNSSTYNTTGNVLINPNGTGNVGIGTATPETGSGVKLDVIGAVKSTEYIMFDSGSFGGAVGYDTSNDELVLKAGGNSVKMTVEGTGNVGIGTVSPNNRLEVLSTTTPQLRVAYDTTNYATFGVDVNGGLTITPNPTTNSTATMLTLALGTVSSSNQNMIVSATRTNTTGNPSTNYWTTNIAPASASTATYYGPIYADTFGTTANLTSAAIYGSIWNTGYNVASGTLATAVGLGSTIYNNQSGGTVTSGYAFLANAPVATGAITNTRGVSISNQGSANVTNAVGLYVDAQSGAATTNYAAIFAGGNVGIGDTTPDAFLEVLGTTEQLRLTYTDGTVDSRFTVDSSGNLNIDNTGTKTVIADDLQVTGNDILDSGTATRITLGTTTTLTNTTTTLSGTSTLTASSLATVTSAATLGMASTTTLNLGSNITINSAATALNLQADGSPDVNIAGGSGTTGCTIANATGNLTCSGTVTGNGTVLSQYWQRLAGNLSPLTLNDTISATSAASTVATFTSSNPAATLTNNTLINHTGAGTVTNLLNLTQSAGAATNGITFSGTFTKLVNSTNFNVTNAGALTAVGVDSGSGLIQGTGGITVTGTGNINSTGTSGTNLGNSTGVLVIASGGTSSWTNTSGNLTITTATSGTLALDSAASLTVGATNATGLTLGRSGVTTTFGATSWTATPTISGLITATSGLTSNGTIAANAAGGITTNQTTFSLVDATATTVNFAGAATTLTIGGTTGTAALRNPTLELGGTGTATIQTNSNDNLTLTPNGSGNLILTGDFDTEVLIGASGASTEFPLLVRSGIGSNAALAVDQLNSGDIFTASASGVTKFTITNAGGIKLGTAEGSANNCLLSGGAGAASSWGACTAGGGVVTSVTGTANQITASPTTGAVVLTLPSAITAPGSLTTTTTLTSTGLLTGNAGLTVTAAAVNLNASSNFATNINTGTSNALVSIGGGSGTAAVSTTNWAVTSAGVGSGFTGFASTGTIAFSGAGAFSVDSSAFDVTSGGAVSGVTTLTSSGSTTLGTGTSTTNTLGSGASSINTIGAVTTPGALTLHGATTLDNTFTVSGNNLTSLGGNLTVTGTAWTATPTISGLITATSGVSVAAGQSYTGAGAVTLSSGANGLLTLTPNGTANTVISSDFDSGTTIGTAITGEFPLLVRSGIGSNAALAVDQLNSGDIFTASASGVTKFTVNNSGGITAAGTITFSGLTASQAVFTDASKNLVSNAITGTGNVVMSASPTLTGTITAAAANFSGAVDLSSTLNVDGTISGNSKAMFVTTDTYLRINQTMASQFTAGVWFGTSNILGSTGYLAMGSNGGTTTSRVYIKGTYTGGVNTIAIDGDAANITIEGTVLDIDSLVFVGAAAINTTDWDISTTGDMTGIGAITANGTVTLTGDFNLTEPSGSTTNVLGTKPASVGTTPGTAAAEILDITAPAGGDTTIATTGVGGIGSGISWTMGAGGVAASAATSSTGGAGGAISFTSGIGGAAAGSATTDIGGAGGAISLTGGTGGAATVGSSLTGGAGGGVTIAAGAAGAGGNANGGTLTLNSGAVTGSGTSTINLGSASVTTLNLGTVANTKTINLGTGTGADTINIGTGATGVDVITIGSSVTSLALNDAQWSITTAGAANFVGVDANAGLLQGALGLTITGAAVNLNVSSNFATNINTGTSTGTVTIGGGSAPLAIDSTGLNVTSAGAVSGVTTLSLSGAITGATATNTINSLIINAGALSGITTITTSGNINSQSIISRWKYCP